MPCIAQSTVWNEGAMKPRGYKEIFKLEMNTMAHARGRHWDSSRLWDYRAINEEQIMKCNHGVDPLGGDLFPTRDERGRIWHPQYGDSQLGPRCCTKALLAPGPDGAVATERYEAFREGVQISEAILFIQRGLDSGKLSPELVQRANKVLDERSEKVLATYVIADKSGRVRFDEAIFGKDAVQREGELYAVAAAVAKTLK